MIDTVKSKHQFTFECTQGKIHRLTTGRVLPETQLFSGTGNLDLYDGLSLNLFVD